MNSGAGRGTQFSPKQALLRRRNLKMGLKVVKELEYLGGSVPGNRMATAKSLGWECAQVLEESRGGQCGRSGVSKGTVAVGGEVRGVTGPDHAGPCGPCENFGFSWERDGSHLRRLS